MPECFRLQRSRWLVGGIIAAHLLAGVALGIAPWAGPVRFLTMVVVSLSLVRELTRPWPAQLRLNMAGDWLLLRSDGSRDYATSLVGVHGPLGVICITLSHQSVTHVVLPPDAFADGNQARLRALIRHRGAAVA